MVGLFSSAERVRRQSAAETIVAVAAVTPGEAR